MGVAQTLTWTRDQAVVMKVNEVSQVRVRVGAAGSLGHTQWAQQLPSSTQAAMWKSEPRVARAFIFQETPEIWMFFVPSLFINIGD